MSTDRTDSSAHSWFRSANCDARYGVALLACVALILALNGLGDWGRNALQENGLVEGGNLFIERRFAEGSFDRASELAAELVRLAVGLIVVSGTNNAIAASKATKTIPIVMANVFDPTALGIVNSLAFPGGNVTGLSNDVSPEMASKRLALLKETVPQIVRVAILMNPDYAQDVSQWEVVQRAAGALNLSLQTAVLRDRKDLDSVFTNCVDNLLTRCSACVIRKP